MLFVPLIQIHQNLQKLYISVCWCINNRNDKHLFITDVLLLCYQLWHFTLSEESIKNNNKSISRLSRWGRNTDTMTSIQRAAASSWWRQTLTHTHIERSDGGDGGVMRGQERSKLRPSPVCFSRVICGHSRARQHWTDRQRGGACVCVFVNVCLFSCSLGTNLTSQMSLNMTKPPFRSI